MSYQKLNQITCPFAFPITFCDDAVQDIDTEAKYFIYMDMDSGYWQVVAEDGSRERLVLFASDVKLWYKVISMGYLNSDTTFLGIVMKKQI